MANLYDSLVSEITAHRKSNDNKYPRKIALTPDQLNSLKESRRLGRLALGESQTVSDTTFLGVALEVDPSTPGVLIAFDGSEVAVGTP
jgi:hypothetical protein